MTYSMNLPVPVAVGNLESYIQAANRFPLLTEAEEIGLARKFRQDGDIEAARGLVLSHLRLVSFAIHWIKAEIHEYILRNWRLVKIATTKAQRKLFFNLRSLKQGLNTMSGDEVGAMAKQLGVKPEEVREMETRLTGRDVAMDGTIDDDGESFAPIAYLADPAEEPSEALANREMEHLQAEGLKQALAHLDARSRRIIERRWLAEEDTATLHELADEYGVSAERIRQIEAKAMQKMKGMLAHTV